MSRWASSFAERPDGTRVPFEAYVVDYDLPADSRRKRFYRRIRRYLAEHGMEGKEWSTGSVVFTDSQDFAWFVYAQARKVGGTSHVYGARRLDEGG